MHLGEEAERTEVDGEQGISAAPIGAGSREQRAIAAEDEDELGLVLGDIVAGTTNSWV